MSSVQVAINPRVIPQKRGTSTTDTSTTDTSSADSPTSETEHNDKKLKKPGRKPITTEATSKRTAQNRAAQRAFRERKQQYLKSLEDRVQELTERQERTEKENQKLQRCIERLKEENITLKNGGKFTYQPPVNIDFEQAISELFEPKNHPAVSTPLDLSATFDLQQAALRGTDLTKPNGNGSPQSVPTMYPTTSGISGTDALLSSTMYDGGVQLLASNQNTTSGSFLDQLFTKGQSPATSTHYSPSDMYVPLNPATSTTPSLSDILSLSPTQQQSTPTDLKSAAAAATSSSLPGSAAAGILPAHLMAYRNSSDPTPEASQGDELEQLLLNSIMTQAPVKQEEEEEEEPECTCRSVDGDPCKLCPKHGSPEDISEELKEMAPEVLGFVCNTNNTMADDELNALCSLMYKQAKCTEVQKKIEGFRQGLMKK